MTLWSPLGCGQLHPDLTQSSTAAGLRGVGTVQERLRCSLALVAFDENAVQVGSSRSAACRVCLFASAPCLRHVDSQPAGRRFGRIFRACYLEEIQSTFCFFLPYSSSSSSPRDANEIVPHSAFCVISNHSASSNVSEISLYLGFPVYS